VQYLLFSFTVCWLIASFRRVSATNSATVYNSCLSKPEDFPEDWFDIKLRAEQVWDGVTLLCLLEDHRDRNMVLQLPHTGDQRDRLTEAVRERNERFEREGQPEWDHYCEKCCFFFYDENGVLSELMALSGLPFELMVLQ
jgi:hypothetical protein